MYSSEMEKKKKNLALNFFSIVGLCHNRVILRCLKQYKSYASALVLFFLLGLFKGFS